MATHDKNDLTRREFVASTGAAVLAVTYAHVQGARAETGDTPKRPNLVVLVTDDQRWDAMSCTGNRFIKTPNMDRLAEEGVLFENHFCTTSICMAGRATIFTGMYTRNHGVDDFSLPLPEARYAHSYPARLREAGYRMGFIGKWGLGGALPKDRFDFFEGFTGQGRYFREIDGKTVHLTRLMGDQIIEFLEGSSADQPFCLSVSFKAPHVQDSDPRQYLYDPAFEGLYADVTMPTPKTAAPKYFEVLPEFIRKSEGRTRWKTRFPTPEKFQESLKGYYRLIAGVDMALGRLLDALEGLGLDNKTVIVFTSDNGLYLGAHGLAGKWLMHEESIRLPLIVRDPRLPKNMQGRRRDEMTLSIDIAPTLLDMAGLDRPPCMQGRSLGPLLERRGVDWRQEWFYEHHFTAGGRIPESEGIRTRTWKYIRYINQEPLHEELYDLKHDPLEEHNLARDPNHQGKLNALRERWRIWHAHLAAFDPDAPTPWTDPGT